MERYTTDFLLLRRFTLLIGGMLMEDDSANVQGDTGLLADDGMVRISRSPSDVTWPRIRAGINSIILRTLLYLLL